MKSVSMHCIVFSRDRAMQLDGFLKSVRQHTPAYTKVTALCKPTSERHRESYFALRSSHPEVQWVHESAFRDDLIGLLDQAPYTVFHTDDDVFFRPSRPLHCSMTKCASAYGLV
jgi:hypothetical protein